MQTTMYDMEHFWFYGSNKIRKMRRLATRLARKPLSDENAQRRLAAVLAALRRQGVVVALERRP